MAFLSDKLVALGSLANKNSNRSQNEQCAEMMKLLIKEKEKGKTDKELLTSVKYAIKQLSEKGFLFYKTNMFFKKAN